MTQASFRRFVLNVFRWTTLLGGPTVDVPCDFFCCPTLPKVFFGNLAFGRRLAVAAAGFWLAV